MTTQHITQPIQSSPLCGPWRSDGPAVKALSHGKWFTIARAASTKLTPTGNEANARLIAAAPELLELCQTILLRLNVEHAERIAKGETSPHFICAALRDDLRAVIAKATGAPSHVSPFTPHPSAQ